MSGERNASYLTKEVGYGYFQRDQIPAEASVKHNRIALPHFEDLKYPLFRFYPTTKRRRGY